MQVGRPRWAALWPALWGIGGVMLLLGSAIVRLGGTAYEGLSRGLEGLQLAALVLVVGVMAWAEGYRGFQRSFAPRVVARARYLAEHPRRAHVLLAPLFCMGFLHATRRRRLSACALTAGVVGLVLLVRLLPEPWRAIVDAGVVVGLGWGIASLAVLAFRAFVVGAPDTCALDLPDS